MNGPRRYAEIMIDVAGDAIAACDAAEGIAQYGAAQIVFDAAVSALLADDNVRKHALRICKERELTALLDALKVASR